MTDSKRAHSRTGYIKFCAVCLAAVLWLLGCSADYGAMIRDPQVTTAFKTNRPLDNHIYYYREWLGEPIAVVGIRKGYTLDSERWFEVDLNEVPLDRLWARMMTRDTTNFNGSKLFDPAGNEMGVLFTDYEGATIKMKSATVIDFITPYGIPQNGDSDSVMPNS